VFLVEYSPGSVLDFEQRARTVRYEGEHTFEGSTAAT
jgi:hypothetical protein